MRITLAYFKAIKSTQCCVGFCVVFLNRKIGNRFRRNLSVEHLRLETFTPGRATGFGRLINLINSLEKKKSKLTVKYNIFVLIRDFFGIFVCLGVCVS